MKKIIISFICSLLVFTLVGCSKSKEEIVENLLNDYINAYMNADVELTKKIFPSFYIEYAEEYMTKEYLESKLNADKEKLGDDFKITYEITSNIKMNDEELKKLNYEMNKYNAKESATECYKLEGSLTFKGSKDTIVDSLSSISCCKYNGNWYLVRVYN